MKYLVQYHNNNDDYYYNIIEASSLEKATVIADSFIKNSYRYEEGWKFRQMKPITEFEKFFETITINEDILKNEYI